MAHQARETDFERTTIERLKLLGYSHVHGSEIERDPAGVVMRGGE